MIKKTSWLLSSVFVIVPVVFLAFCHLLLTDVRSYPKVQISIHNVPDDFNWKIYIQNYDDLRNAGINTEEKAKKHWAEYGKSEGRIYWKVLAPVPEVGELLPPDFDWETYVNNYEDLENTGIDTKQKAAEHWLKIGKKEGRTYQKILYQPATIRPDFDWQTYVNNYPELRAAGIDTKEKAEEHWLKQGKREGRTYHKIIALGVAGSGADTSRPSSRNAGDFPQDSKDEAMEYWLKQWGK